MTDDRHGLAAQGASGDRDGSYNFVADVMARWRHETPDATALLWTDGQSEVRLSFAELFERARRAATVLRNSGVRRGDIVMILLSRELPWWELMLGCLRLGALPSPATVQLGASEIAYRVEASGARAIVANSRCAARVEEAALSANVARLIVGDPRPNWRSYDLLASLPPLDEAEDEIAETSAREDALCYFTSGTTGYPKMTIHRHDYPLGHRVTADQWLALRPGDTCWNLADTGWAKAAWSSLFAPWLAGATIFSYQADSFDSKTVLHLLSRMPVTTLCAPPTAYRMMLQEDPARFRFPTLRRCVAAGEPLGEDAMVAWRAATGLDLAVGYGQTETGLLCADLLGAEIRPGAMGRPVPGIRLTTIDDDGQELPAGAEGDLALLASPERPPGLFKEYRDDPQRTAATRKGDWYLTGDRAMRDEDGYLWFVGRADDVILSSGYRIGPFEVESALNAHAAVVESAVVSSPDPTRGEIVKAFVILAADWTASDDLARTLQDHVKASTAPYKYPRSIAFVESLPKTVSGKILRRELRDAEWEK